MHNATNDTHTTTTRTTHDTHDERGRAILDDVAVRVALHRLHDAIDNAAHDARDAYGSRMHDDDASSFAYRMSGIIVACVRNDARTHNATAYTPDAYGIRCTCDACNDTTYNDAALCDACNDATCDDDDATREGTGFEPCARCGTVDAFTYRRTHDDDDARNDDTRTTREG